MIELELNDEQVMLRDAAERYLRDHYDFGKVRSLAASAEDMSDEAWRAMAELGWLGLALPEHLGGQACGLAEVVLIAEELGRALVPSPFLSTAVLAVELLRRTPASPDRDDWLRRIATGDLRVALAHLEPGMGYLSSLTGGAAGLMAYPCDAGWRLTGHKLLVCGAPAAGLLVVSARFAGAAPDGSDWGLYAVDAHAPGISCEPYDLLDGTRAADVTLTDVTIKSDALLASGAQADALLGAALDAAALAAVADALGCMEAILELSSTQLKSRSQFGQTLSRFQALQHRMAEMFVEVQETRSLLVQGLVNLERSDDERSAAVSAAKAYADRAGRFVGSQGVQLHGGLGVSDEVAVGHYYKRLLFLGKVFGDAEDHLERYVRLRFG